MMKSPRLLSRLELPEIYNMLPNSSELLIKNATTVRQIEEALARGPSEEALRLARANVGWAQKLLAQLNIEQLVANQGERKRKLARAAASSQPPEVLTA
jgi:hypothetical protein